MTLHDANRHDESTYGDAVMMLNDAIVQSYKGKGPPDVIAMLTILCEALVAEHGLEDVKLPSPEYVHATLVRKRTEVDEKNGAET